MNEQIFINSLLQKESCFTAIAQKCKNKTEEDWLEEIFNEESMESLAGKGNQDLFWSVEALDKESLLFLRTILDFAEPDMTIKNLVKAYSSYELIIEKERNNIIDYICTKERIIPLLVAQVYYYIKNKVYR